VQAELPSPIERVQHLALPLARQAEELVPNLPAKQEETAQVGAGERAPGRVLNRHGDGTVRASGIRPFSEDAGRAPYRGIA
jgi:hypothetical protein